MVILKTYMIAVWFHQILPSCMHDCDFSTFRWYLFKTIFYAFENLISLLLFNASFFSHKLWQCTITLINCILSWFMDLYMLTLSISLRFVYNILSLWLVIPLEQTHFSVKHMCMPLSAAHYIVKYSFMLTSVFHLLHIIVFCISLLPRIAFTKNSSLG